MNLLLLCFTSFIVLTVAAGAEQPSLVQTAALVRAGAVVQLPGLTIRGGDKMLVEATGSVSLTNGILEFIAVEPKGRDYESLLTLNCKPSALKFALLLIGWNRRRNPTGRTGQQTR